MSEILGVGPVCQFNRKIRISDSPTRPGERMCAKCQVYMHSMQGDDWYCSFLEPDCKTPLPRKVTLKTESEVRAMIERVSPMTEHELEDFGTAVEIAAAECGSR